MPALLLRGLLHQTMGPSARPWRLEDNRTWTDPRFLSHVAGKHFTCISQGGLRLVTTLPPGQVGARALLRSPRCPPRGTEDFGMACRAQVLASCSRSQRQRKPHPHHSDKNKDHNRLSQEKKQTNTGKLFGSLSTFNFNNLKHFVKQAVTLLHL